MKAVGKGKSTLGELLELGGAINDIVKSAPVVSGKLAYALTKNGKALMKYRIEAQDAFNELVTKHVVLDEAGQPTNSKDGEGRYPFAFKSDDDAQKFEAEMKKQDEKEFDTPKLHKVDKVLLENLEIPMMANPNFVLVVDTLGK